MNPFVSGSPAELSPTTLSPVNHSLGKLQMLRSTLPPFYLNVLSGNYFPYIGERELNE